MMLLSCSYYTYDESYFSRLLRRGNLTPRRTPDRTSDRASGFVVVGYETTQA